jgi:hypothetical protein
VFNDGVRTIKLGHQTTGNAHVIWSDELSFTTSGRVYIWRIPKKAYNPEYLVPTAKPEGCSVMVWGILLVPLLTIMAELLEGSM